MSFSESGLWNTLARNKTARLERASSITSTKIVEQKDLVRLFESVIESGDRVCIEGNNQKHADYLSQQLALVDPKKVNNLHIVQSNIALSSHLDIFEKGIAKKLDFCYSGEQGVRLGRLIKEGVVEIGAIHTYLELYSRYFVDLTPIFTRDPALITEIQILMAMMVIKGIYMPYGINRLNHGIGFDTAAIELILPTYGNSLGLKGKICQYMSVNPCPTLIPAIESGFIKNIHCAGSELGMEEYIVARPDIFFNGPDGSMRSNRAFCQLAGHYADLFIGSTLQIDIEGNSSTATLNRIAGFGGAPNFGSDSKARRHSSKAWLMAGKESMKLENSTMPRGRKLVVQIVETFKEKMQPTFVERLDAWQLMDDFDLDLPPVMVYGDDVTHLVTEEGIANLHKCKNLNERVEAIRGVAGYTPVGLKRNKSIVSDLISRGIIQRPQDLGIDMQMANRNLLAARSIKDLVKWSDGLYNPPKRFRNW